MGTEARIILYAPHEAIAEKATRAAFARIEEIDSLLSDYRDASEVATIGRAKAGETVTVSGDLATVLAVSMAMSEQTGGAFDVTAGPLTHLWRDARARGTIPDSASICRARLRVGWQRVKLASKGVSFARDSMRLDFGGIAKGYAADAALTVLRIHGVPRALVIFGGEIVAGDRPPRDEGWPVSIDGDSARQIISNSAVSTSGDAEQFVDVGGVRYSHVIDPRSGRALTSRVSATVEAPSGMIADALATSATVLDSAAAVRLIAHYPGARLVRRTSALSQPSQEKTLCR